jgi:hypothetical protein
VPLGQTEPAMQPQAKGGQEARGDIVAGLGLEMIRMAQAMYPGTSEKGILLAEVSAKLGRGFKKPPQELGEAELKFMHQSLYPGQRPAAMDMGGQVRSSLMGQGIPAPQQQAAAAAAPGPQGG